MARKSAPDVEREEDNFTVYDDDMILQSKPMHKHADDGVSDQDSSKGSITALSLDESLSNGCDNTMSLKQEDTIISGKYFGTNEGLNI